MKRTLLAVLAGSAVALLITMVGGGGGAATVFGAVAIVFPVPLMALGALRRGRLGGAGWALLALALLLEGGYWAMVVLAGRVGEAPRVAGLPLAAVAFLVSIWLGPLLLVSWAFAATFDEHGVSEEDLQRLRTLRDRGGER